MDRHLQVFVTVAEKQSFSRAAEEHHMTQPAVSQYIRLFEEMIGTRLLERNNKYVRLNKAGEIVYHYAKEILSLYTKMENLVGDLENKTNGPLSIGASYTFGEYVLPKMIANLLHKYPDIEPTVTIGNTAKIADLVATHQLDIGIVEGRFKGNELHEEVFALDLMVVIASPNHYLAQMKNTIELNDLEDETWIVRELGSGTREATDRLFKFFTTMPMKCMYFSSTQPIKESVEAGLGISLLSKWAVQKEIQNGDLITLNISGLPLSREFSMVTKSQYRTKALDVFIDLLHHNKQLTTLSQINDQ